MKPASVFIILSLLLAVSACDDNSTDNGEDYIIPTILQPLDGDTIRDSTYTIRVDAVQNCGCLSWVAFYIDNEIVYTDELRPFSYDMDSDDWQGERTFKVHAVVPGSSYPNGIRVEGWDSVRVTIDLTK